MNRKKNRMEGDWTGFVWFMIKTMTGFCDLGNEYLG